MAVSPINLSRVSHNLRAETLMRSVQRGSLEMFLQQNRLATGRAFVSASEDPVAASQALALRETIDRQAQISENIQHASNVLNATDSSLAEVASLLNEAHALALQNAGSLVNDDERQASATLVSEIIRQLVNVGNRQFGKFYLFAGRDTTHPPFRSDVGGVVYSGDTGDVLARLSLLEDAPINLPGNVLFGAVSAQVSSSVDLTPALAADTRLDTLRGARDQGVHPGPLTFSEAGGTTFTVDLSLADTVGDLVDLINAAATAAGSGLTAELSADGITLTPGDAPVEVTGGDGDAMLRDLGLFGVSPIDAPHMLDQLNPRLTPTTAIADLARGGGLDLTDGFTITNGDVSAAIDLSEAASVQDILNAVNTAGIGVRARINEAGDGLELINLVSGTLLSVGENGGSVAADLGIRTMDERTTLSELNFGNGVEQVEGSPDFRINTRSGGAIDVDLDGATTVSDVLMAINDAAQLAALDVRATISSSGGGIQIDDATMGSNPLSVSRLNFSFAADDLGLLKTAAAGESTLIGDDVAAVRADGVLTALIDLERSLRAESIQGINDAGERLGPFISELNRVHGDVGARARAVERRRSGVEDAVVATRAFLSQVEDVDFAEAVTRFQQAQTSLQSILLTGSRLLNVSLLDFLG